VGTSCAAIPAPTQLSSGAPANPLELLADSSNGQIYFTTAGTGGLGLAPALYRMPIGGGTQTQIVALAAPPYSLAVDTTSIYYVRAAPKAGGATAGVWRSPLTALGNSLVFNAPEIGAIALRNNIFYYTDPGNGTVGTFNQGTLAMSTLTVDPASPTAIAVDANNVYWTDLLDGTVHQMALTGGSPLTIARVGVSLTPSLVVDSTYVYFSDGQGTVWGVPIGGGPPIALATGQGSSLRLAVDASTLYWTDAVNGTVMKVSLCGGSPIALVSGQPAPTGIDQDGGHIYFDTDVAPSGTILAVSK
jgi:hypothetical protein